MKPIHTFTVVPALPDKLQRLREMAYNILWSWDHETIDLFRRLDSDLWEESGHNPVLMLGTIAQDRLGKAARDDGFLAQLERDYQRFNRHMGQTTW